MKKFLAVLFTIVLVSLAFGGSASAAGSDGPTPYTVDASGVTLPAGDTYKDGGHVNIKYTVNGGAEKSKGIHFEALNNQPSGKWIGKSNIPWSAFGLSGSFCVTRVQVHGYNEHYGEGGQGPICVGPQPEPDPDPKPGPHNKKITLCHATGSSSNPYVGITVSVAAWYNSGHVSHAGDIWEAFSYYNKDGDKIDVPAQGDTSLLQHSNCQPPKVPTKVVPDITKVDKCGTKNDSVALVPGTGYTGGVVKNGLVYTVTAETDEGFVFNAAQMGDWTLSNGDTKAVKQITLTNEDCDLPETGGAAQYNTTLGILALLGIAAVGAGLFFTRRKSA